MPKKEAEFLPDIDEFMEEMENTPLSSEEDEEEAWVAVSEEKESGMVRVETSDGETFTIPLKQYQELLIQISSTCPFCHHKELGILIETNPHGLRLWCENCDKKFQVVDGDICLFSD